MRRYLLCAVILAGAATQAFAQSIPGAVLAKHEPHHHLAYEDGTMRVLRVRVAPHDTTLLHEHDPDYFWIALGASDVVNARLGAPDATISSEDLSIHYTPGRFAHVARNPGTAPFDNITVELLRPQTNVRNVCEPAVSGRPLECAERTRRLSNGVSEHDAFATDQLRVGLLTIGPSARASGRDARTWLIALDTADTRSSLTLDGRGNWSGGVYRSNGGSWAVRNRSPRELRMLIVTAGATR